MSKPASDKSDVVREVPLACADESAAVEFIEKLRWSGEAACPRCGDTNVYQMKDRKTGKRNARYLWRCRGCSRQYTVRIGTILEDSRIPLRHWCFAFWAACSSKKGVSALQIKRQTGLSYKSALFMMHRIRFVMADPGGPPKLTGTIEADETYVGGKPRYKGTTLPGRGTCKTPVVGIVERGGDIRYQVMPRVTRKNLGAMIAEHVDENARLVTDEYSSYKQPGKRQKGGHDVIKHSSGQYAKGDIYTNTIESAFSLIKRGVYGTFHSVSKKHLHRYLAEFSYRWNTRKIDDGERLRIAIKRSEGRRLRYHQPA